MNVGEVTKALQEFVEASRERLEEILREPVKEYVAAIVADPAWFAAVMHTSGSEPEEALRLGQNLERKTTEELVEEVTQRLAGGIVSTGLVPAVLPAPLLSSANQALLACLREQAEDRTLDTTVEESDG